MTNDWINIGYMTRTVLYQIGRVYVAVAVLLINALRYATLRLGIRPPRRELDRSHTEQCESCNLHLYNNPVDIYVRTVT